jgi:hypothetical protein
MRSAWKWRAQTTAIAMALVPMALACVLASSARTERGYGSKPPVAANPIPVGTILPIRLEHGLSVEEAQAGQEIEAHITQEVPLPNHQKLHVRSDVHGTLVSVAKKSDGSGVELSLRFDKVELNNKMVAITASLRAMAFFEAVHAAQIPLTGADTGTPTGWGDTVQIGGDIRFGDGGEVRNRHKQKVGKGVFGGVLVHISAQPGSGCEGPENGDNRLQALWVFSADACGLYGFKDVQIAHNGKTDPVGVITLRFEKEKAKLDASTGILLRTVAAQ